MIELRPNLEKTLLDHYLANHRASHPVGELADLLGVDSSDLSGELYRLEREGIFRSEWRGNHKHYSLDPASPFLKELFTVLLERVGVAPALSETLEKIPGIRMAYLVGAFAKAKEADQYPAGEIDILIVGEPSPAELAKHTFRLEKLLDRKINYMVMTDGEMRQKLARRDPFLTDLWQGDRVELISG
jgi:hypothetical protein